MGGYLEQQIDGFLPMLRLNNPLWFWIFGKIVFAYIGSDTPVSGTS